MAVQSPARQRFAGFPPGGFDFFLELQARQDREWFKANKQRYEDLWVRPLDALFDDLIDHLGDVFPEIQNAGKRIFRIQRDTRFSADKSPYKTHIAAHTPIHPVAGEAWGTPSLYMHFGLDDSVLGLGNWQLDKEVLTRFRERLADDRTGGELEKLLAKAYKAGFALSQHEMLKRVPAPYPQDHPRAELLKRKDLSIHIPDLPEDLMAKPELVGWLSERIHH